MDANSGARRSGGRPNPLPHELDPECQTRGHVLHPDFLPEVGRAAPNFGLVTVQKLGGNLFFILLRLRCGTVLDAILYAASTSTKDEARESFPGDIPTASGSHNLPTWHYSVKKTHLKCWVALRCICLLSSESGTAVAKLGTSP